MTYESFTLQKKKYREVTACTAHPSSLILATCALSPFVFCFQGGKTQPKQYTQGTQQSNGMNVPLESTRMPATLMGSKQDAGSFSVPQLLHLHFQKSNTRVSVCYTDQLGQRNQDSDPRSHSKVKRPPPLQSTVHEKQGCNSPGGGVSDRPVAGSSWIVLTSCLTLPLLEGAWRDQGAAELGNTRDLGVREGPQNPA